MDIQQRTIPSAEDIHSLPLIEGERSGHTHSSFPLLVHLMARGQGHRLHPVPHVRRLQHALPSFGRLPSFGALSSFESMCMSRR